MSGGWSPTIHLASQAGARPVWDADLQAFLPPAPDTGLVRCRRLQRHILDRRSHCRRLCRRTQRSGPAGARHRNLARCRPRAARSAPGTGLRDQGQGKVLRRLPARRDSRRRAAGASRRFRLGRAPQALHHARHGHRPGQELQRARPRHHGRGARQADPRGRHDPLPPAFRAGFDRRAGCRALRPPQARAADADA